MPTETHYTPTVDTLTRLIKQQNKVAELCPCGKFGQCYADDGRTPLCAVCWLKIYAPEEK